MKILQCLLLLKMSVQTSCKNGQKKHDDLTLIALRGIVAPSTTVSTLKGLWAWYLVIFCIVDVRALALALALAPSPSPSPSQSTTGTSTSTSTKRG